MFVDFHALPDGQTIDADLCIIGAGPAGIVLAREFCGTSTDVVLLESGGLRFEAASETLNAGESVGLHYNGLTQGRRRQFAGAANIWGRVCVELDDADFAERPWVSRTGWPFSKSELRPFYSRARAMLELGPAQYTAADWRDFGMRTAEFDERELHFSVAPTTPVGDFGKAFGPDLRTARNVRVLVHATVTQLETNVEGTAMKSVEIRSLDGKGGRVRARRFVLCCGGIENARLLLLSRRTQACGLGNGYDLVGRYLADHSASMSARITPAPGTTLQSMFRSLRRGGISLRPRFALAPRIQAEAGVLNCMAQVHFEYPSDSAFAAAMNLRKALRFRRKPADLRRTVRRVLSDPVQLATMAVDRYARGRHPADGAPDLFLECISEQAPNPNSSVTLAAARDPFGSPKARVDWRTADIERRTIAQMTGAVAREFDRLGLGTVVPESWLTEGTGWESRLTDGFHHLGTTRMAVSPRDGVVDTDGNVHGVAGLYVCGSSVFPLAGYANSTLTIVALAVRLADHLKRAPAPPRVNAGVPAATSLCFDSPDAARLDPIP